MNSRQQRGMRSFIEFAEEISNRETAYQRAQHLKKAKEQQRQAQSRLIFSESFKGSTL